VQLRAAAAQRSVSAASAASALSSSAVAVSLYAVCEGAADALACVGLDPSGRLVAAGDWRGGVLVWDATHTPAHSEDGGEGPNGDASMADGSSSSRKGHASKRARKGSAASDGAAAAAAATVTVTTRIPVFVFRGRHAGCVSGVAWVSSGAVASCGWDRTIRVWDVEAAAAAVNGGKDPAEAAQITVLLVKLIFIANCDILYSFVCGLQAPKTVHCIAASPLGSLLATGHADGVVRIWDTRGRSAVGDAAASASKGPEGLRASLGHPKGAAQVR
jgi:WD40 repeat protein